MNKKRLFLTGTFALFFGLTFAQSVVKQPQEKRPVMVGADRDKHGCIASAGYTYSIIKNDCVRLFEQKCQLKEINPKGSSTSNSAIIFSSDNKKAEAFLPDLKSSVILIRTGTKGKYIWRKDKLALYQKGNDYILKRSNKAIFSQVNQ